MHVWEFNFYIYVHVPAKCDLSDRLSVSDITGHADFHHYKA